MAGFGPAVNLGGGWSVTAIAVHGPGVPIVMPWRVGTINLSGKVRRVALYGWAPVGPLAVPLGGVGSDGVPFGGLAFVEGGPFSIPWKTSVEVDGATVDLAFDASGVGNWWDTSWAPSPVGGGGAPPPAPVPWLWIGLAVAAALVLGGKRG